MSDAEYRMALEDYRARLVEATRRRDEINIEIRKLQGNINALNTLLRLPMESFKRARVSR